MPEASNITVELVVPTSLSAAIERQPNLRLLSKTEVTDEKLRFGIIELTALLVFAKTQLEIVKLCLEIWRLLGDAEDEDAKALVRSPLDSETIEISARDDESEVRIKIERLLSR